MVFKSINKLSPEYINVLIEIKTSTYNFRVERQAKVPRVKMTRYGQRSFRSDEAPPCMEQPSRRAAGFRIIPPVP